MAKNAGGAHSSGGGANWGAASTAQFRHAGNPNGHVVAIAAGDLCDDTSTPALWQASAPGNSHWAVIGGGSGSYASLLGAGQATTPGDLTQTGGLFVIDGAYPVVGDGVGINTTYGVAVQADYPNHFGPGIFIETVGVSGAIVLNDTTTDGSGITLESSLGAVKIGSTSASKVGFFGAAPVVQPGAPATLGDVIAALTALGLVG